MKKTGFLLTLLAAIALAVPPTLHADCITYANRYVGYFPSCSCTACAGWAVSNCTECSDGGGGYCQSTAGECGPLNPV